MVSLSMPVLVAIFLVALALAGPAADRPDRHGVFRGRSRRRPILR
jgi:hypothetical protein